MDLSPDKKFQNLGRNMYILGFLRLQSSIGIQQLHLNRIMHYIILSGFARSPTLIYSVNQGYPASDIQQREITWTPKWKILFQLHVRTCKAHFEYLCTCKYMPFAFPACTTVSICTREIRPTLLRRLAHVACASEKTLHSPHAQLTR